MEKFEKVRDAYPTKLHCVLFINLLHKDNPMRINITVDDTLMADVLKATGAKSKREAIELGLKALLMLKQQECIKAFKGKLKWDGDLEQMRINR
jgi:Arc/MetJ family transcription regulator